MWKNLVDHPARMTAVITVMAVGVSLAVSIVVFFLFYPDINARLHFTLSLLMPTLLAPTTIYPVTKANYRLRQVKRQLQALARTDPLTELPNRRHFFEYADEARARLEEGGTHAMFMIDIDHFKEINDSYGHDAGDAVIRAVGRAIGDAVEEGCQAHRIVARVGGEEFAVLVEGMDERGAVVLAGQICTRVRRAWTNHLGRPLSRTASVGLAVWTAGQSVDAVLGLADDALYEAKRTGRDRWCCDAVRGDPPADARKARFPVARGAASRYPTGPCAPASTPAPSIP